MSPETAPVTDQSGNCKVSTKTVTICQDCYQTLPAKQTLVTMGQYFDANNVNLFYIEHRLDNFVQIIKSQPLQTL